MGAETLLWFYPVVMLGLMGMPGTGTGTGTMGQQPEMDPRQLLDEQIADYQAQNTLADTVLRSATRVDDLTYQGITMPGGRDAADAILARSGVEPPRMGSLLWAYSSWVADLPPGADRTIDRFLVMSQTPQSAGPGTALQSQYPPG